MIQPLSVEVSEPKSAMAHKPIQNEPMLLSSHSNSRNLNQWNSQSYKLPENHYITK